ncbi:hypothetical protein [Jiella sonneratiae]|nr:hypothetical protein [Jiella sonneratiae]
MTAVVVMQKSAFDALPEKIQTALLESAHESAEWQRSYVEDQETPLLDALKEKGVKITRPDPAPFRKASIPLYKEMLKSDSQKALFDALTAE